MAYLLRTVCRRPRLCGNAPRISRTVSRSLFFEPFKRPAKCYEEAVRDWESKSVGQKVVASFNSLVEECQLFQKEWQERLQMDYEVPDFGETKTLWKFNNRQILDKFTITSDSALDEGFSQVKFELSPTGHGLFHGYLDATNLPQDGSVVRVGWANIQINCPTRSFYRDGYFDWSEYTHLVMRVRGDGRTYSLILGNSGYFDIHWFDLFTYGLYTHGGPYWQYVKIPFSKFVFTHKASVQDQQFRVHLDKISAFGITLMDRNTGPFCLEIDYVGLQYDPHDYEESAYEHYQIKEFDTVC